ncbi:MAG: T9SS type A sorting domain-containing protein [Bacteroidetes bacterium]|nr:T9SS type A sorting domain-containing protein [Bacteroidota bacterium]
MRISNITLFLILYINFVNAQPVLTKANTMLTAGETIILNKANYQNQGVSGPNQIWDYSLVLPTSTISLSIKTTTSNNYINPSALNYTVSDSINGTIGYYSFFNDSCFSNENFINSCSYNYPLVLNYPFNYGDSIYSTKSFCFAQNVSFGGTQVNKAKFDAFGTLILPNNTYSNVARIKYVSIMECHTSTQFLGNSQVTAYIYYLPNCNYPIAKSLDIFIPRPSNPPTISQNFYYQNSVNVGLKEHNISDAISLFPNPANKVLYIRLNNYHTQLSCIIKDIYGNQILASTINLNQPDSHEEINISSLNSGIYFIELLYEGLSITKKFIVNQ